MAVTQGTQGTTSGIPKVKQTYEYKFEPRFPVEPSPSLPIFYDTVTREQFLPTATADVAVGETTWTYDRLGQLQVVADTDPNSSTSSPQVAAKSASFVYDVSGNLQQIDRPNVPDTYYGYDQANRVKSILHDTDPGTNDIWHNLGYDNASRITGFTTFGAGGGTRGYAYDEAGQLTSKTGGTGNESYTYDDNGNRTSVGGQTIVTGVGNRLTDDGTYTYTYDHEGNLTQRTLKSDTTQTTEYVWDHRNRLTSVIDKNGATITQTIQYTYDAQGRRVKRAIDVDGGTPTFVHEYFVYDSNGNSGNDLSMSFGHAGQLEHRYLYGPAVDQVLVDEVFGAGAGGQQVSDEILWQLGDHQGTIRDIVDGNGTLRKHINYDSFGKLGYQQYYYENGEPIESLEPAELHAEAVDQFFYFQGRPWDPVAETYDFRARPYRPSTGRFDSEDPVFAPNLYPVVGNGITYRTDPTGAVQAGNPLNNLFGGYNNPYIASANNGSLSLGTLGKVLGNSVIKAAPSLVSPGIKSAVGTLNAIAHHFRTAAGLVPATRHAGFGEYLTIVAAIART